MILSFLGAVKDPISFFSPLLCKSSSSSSLPPTQMDSHSAVKKLQIFTYNLCLNLLGETNKTANTDSS